MSLYLPKGTRNGVPEYNSGRQFVIRNLLALFIELCFSLPLYLRGTSSLV